MCCLSLAQTQYQLQTPAYPNGSWWSEDELYTPYYHYDGNDTYQNGSYIGLAGGAGWSGICDGQGTWRWNWGATTTPPHNVIIKVTSSAWYSVSRVDGSGDCDDGYHDAKVPANTPKTKGETSNGVHYIIWNDPGSTFFLQLTPTAHSYDGPCSVTVSMDVTDVKLDVAGGIHSGYTDDSCMVGQYNQGTLSAGPYLSPPSGVIQSLWTFSSSEGTPLQQDPNWGGPKPQIGTISYPEQHHWNPMPDSTTITGLTTKWFAVNPTNEQITAQSMAYDSGGHTIGPVSGKYYMTAVGPTGVNISGTPGTAISRPTDLASGLDPENAPGMTFSYGAATPVAYKRGLADYGMVMMAQIVDFTSTSPGNTTSSNGPALDNTFPYKSSGTAYGIGGVPDVDTPHYTHVPVGTVNVSYKFKSFLTYYPPENGLGSEYVPLDSYYWKWITSDSYPFGHSVASPVPDGKADYPYAYFQWYQRYSNPIGGGQ